MAFSCASKWIRQSRNYSRHSSSDSLASLLCDLKSCRSLRDLHWGMRLHGTTVKCGLDSNIFVATALLDMYAKCGSMEKSRAVFDRMKVQDVVSWSALILGYAENGQGLVALSLFYAMQRKGCAPNARTFVAALSACSSLAATEEEKTGLLVTGRSIHREAAKLGFEKDIFVANSLVDMYVKCGSVMEAFQVFERMERRDVITWTALMLGYAASGEADVVFQLFSRMESEGCVPDRLVFVAAIMACATLTKGSLECLQKVMSFHVEAARKGFDLDIFVANTLIDTYGKCGSLIDARMVFDRMPRQDVVSWTALILGYTENGEATLALELFECMRCEANTRTFVAVLAACASVAANEGSKVVSSGTPGKIKSLEKGMQLHAQATRCRYDEDIYVANTLVDMYSKCGSLTDACRVFNGMQHHDLVSWNALICGHIENDRNGQALDLFEEMQRRGCVADATAYISALMSCACLANLRTGRRVHAQLCRSGLETERFVVNSLVDMYAKCGRQEDVEQVFFSLRNKETATWNALLAGYSRQGNFERVLDLFRVMEDEGLQVDAITFLLLLTSCSHSGLVDKGLELFEAMTDRYGVDRSIEHYHSVVDMLGRCNQLERAVAVVKSMPFEATAVTWNTVLSSCVKWKNLEMGKLAFQSLLKVDENKPAAYVLMANIYGSLGIYSIKASERALT